MVTSQFLSQRSELLPAGTAQAHRAEQEELRLGTNDSNYPPSPTAARGPSDALHKNAHKCLILFTGETQYDKQVSSNRGSPASAESLRTGLEWCTANKKDEEQSGNTIKNDGKEDTDLFLFFFS